MRKILYILAIFALAACSSREGSMFHNVGPKGWAYADTCEYRILEHAADTVQPTVADVAIAIRHTNTYEYANIWLELTYSTGGKLRVDTFNIKLADDFGHWLGKGVGVGYQLVNTVLHNMPLDTVAPLTMRHIMRADTLEGIEQVGIIFKPRQ